MAGERRRSIRRSTATVALRTETAESSGWTVTDAKMMSLGPTGWSGVEML